MDQKMVFAWVKFELSANLEIRVAFDNGSLPNGRRAIIENT